MERFKRRGLLRAVATTLAGGVVGGFTIEQVRPQQVIQTLPDDNLLDFRNNLDKQLILITDTRRRLAIDERNIVSLQKALAEFLYPRPK